MGLTQSTSLLEIGESFLAEWLMLLSSMQSLHWLTQGLSLALYFIISPNPLFAYLSSLPIGTLSNIFINATRYLGIHEKHVLFYI